MRWKPREAIAVLTGGGPPDTRELTLALGVEMLLASGSESSAERARQRLESALASGAAAERFERMIALHGGDAGVVADPARLPRGEPLARLHCTSVRWAPKWQTEALGAFTLSERKPRLRSRVLERFG